MVAAYDKQGVVQLADCLQAFDDYAQSRIEGDAFTEIVVEVLSYLMHVGEKGGHATFQVIGV